MREFYFFRVEFAVQQKAICKLNAKMRLEQNYAALVAALGLQTGFGVYTWHSQLAICSFNSICQSCSDKATKLN